MTASHPISDIPYRIGSNSCYRPFVAIPPHEPLARNLPLRLARTPAILL